MKLIQTSCPDCSGGLQEVILQSSQHYSRIECAECKRFVRWGKSPSSLAKKQILEYKVRCLKTLTSLSQWETSFIASVSQQLDNGKTLSPKQIEWLGKIYDKYTQAS